MAVFELLFINGGLVRFFFSVENNSCNCLKCSQAYILVKIRATFSFVQKKLQKST